MSGGGGGGLNKWSYRVNVLYIMLKDEMIDTVYLSKSLGKEFGGGGGCSNLVFQSADLMY